MNVRDVGRAMLAGVTLPWAGFVAGFVYFVILTAIVIGGIDLSWQVLAARLSAAGRRAMRRCCCLGLRTRWRR